MDAMCALLQSVNFVTCGGNKVVQNEIYIILLFAGK